MAYATLKYDPSRNRLWVRRYDGSAHGEDVANAIAVDAAGDAFVTGYSEVVRAPNGFPSVVYATLKYAPDGTLLWTNLYNDAANAVDDLSNVYVAGISQPYFGSSDIRTVKYRQ